MQIMERKIIAISGQIASGKSTISGILCKQLNCRSLSFGKLIWNILNEEGQAITRGTLQDRGLEIINKYGYNGIAKLLIDSNNLNDRSSYIIEGIRHPKVCDYYQNFFGSIFKLVYVECSQELRFSRIKGQSNKNIIIENIDDLIKIENHPVEIPIPSLKLCSSKIINNEGTIKVLTTELETLLTELYSR
jgi:dephospho-CoA kinase